MKVEDAASGAAPETAAPPERGAQGIDFGVGIFFVGLGCFVLWAGRDLAIQATNRPGPGLLPTILAVICIVGGLVLAIQQLVRPTTRRYRPSSPAGNQRVASVLVLTVVTVVLFEPLGFIASTMLLMAGIMFGVERKFTIVSVATVVLIPIVFWTLFAVLLGVRLPAGLLYF